jgi:hypothetical protein
MIKILTTKVRDGLRHIGAEMGATADTMQEDRREEAEAIRAALEWIHYQETRIDRQRALRGERP